jgi:hypothetical protein
MKAIIITLRMRFAPDRYLKFTELYQRKHGSVPHGLTLRVEANSQTRQSFAARVG